VDRLFHSTAVTYNLILLLPMPIELIKKEKREKEDERKNESTREKKKKRGFLPISLTFSQAVDFSFSLFYFAQRTSFS